uniref:DUF659 domain-containing protein n=2 Tax=Quercus lobata TaxID=97700 RepID=A0A7N2QZ99_QUELO
MLPPSSIGKGKCISSRGSLGQGKHTLAERKGKAPSGIGVNSKYYQQMIDAIASIGPGNYKGPGFYALRGYLLAKNVEEVKNFVDSYRVTWKETGCTIMADGWNRCRRTLINFLVYCPRGIVFLKSDDAPDASKTADMLYKLLREVVLVVGPENVVQIVTDNSANYVAARKLLEQEFYTLRVCLDTAEN